MVTGTNDHTLFGPLKHVEARARKRLTHLSRVTCLVSKARKPLSTAAAQRFESHLESAEAGGGTLVVEDIGDLAAAIGGTWGPVHSRETCSCEVEAPAAA
jgi:hypothetical protein